jgi:putative acetyltransferase
MTPTPVPDSTELADAPSWSIRPEQPIDLDQIHDLHREAFHRPDEADLVDAIRSGPDFLPDLSLVAVADDGSVLGHILVSRVRFEPHAVDAVRSDALALAPLAVLQPHEGRGIGSALTRDALALADARDEPFTVVVGSPAYYGRFGFAPAAEHSIDGPYDAAGEAFQVRPRPGGAPLTPGSVVYPRMFEGL